MQMTGSATEFIIMSVTRICIYIYRHKITGNALLVLILHRNISATNGDIIIITHILDFDHRRGNVKFNILLLLRMLYKNSFRHQFYRTV